MEFHETRLTALHVRGLFIHTTVSQPLVQNTPINNNSNSNDNSINHTNNSAAFHGIFFSLFTNRYKNNMQQMLFYIYFCFLDEEAGAQRR